MRYHHDNKIKLNFNANYFVHLSIKLPRREWEDSGVPGKVCWRISDLMILFVIPNGTFTAVGNLLQTVLHVEER